MTQAILHSLDDGSDIPPGGEVHVLATAGGIELRVARWRESTTGTNRGTVVVFHGYTEYIEKYYEVVRELRAQGFAVVTFDWRGQGLSTRLLPNRYKGHVEDYAHFLSDALLVYEGFVRAGMSRPHVLLAHSMGGHLGLRFLQDYPGRFERAVLSAPMLGWDQFPLSVARAVAAANVALGQGTSYTWLRGDPDPNNPVNDVTSDEKRFARNGEYLQRAPELHLGGPTWRWLQQATASTMRIMDRDRLIRVKTPVLVASAEDDRVISSAKHEPLPFLNPAFTVRTIEGAMHEILQETDEVRARFWDRFERFLR